MNENKKELHVEDEKISDSVKLEWSSPSITSLKITQLTAGIVPILKDLPIPGLNAIS